MDQGGAGGTSREMKWERIDYQMQISSGHDDAIFQTPAEPFLPPLDRFIAQLNSSQPSDIYSGLLGLTQLADASDRSLFEIDDSKFEILAARLSEISSLESFQVRHPHFELELISKLCRKDLKFAHKFWNRDLQHFLLELLSKNILSCHLDAPIQILSSMSRFATAVHGKLVEWGYIECLLDKVKNPQLSEADLFSVLSGLIQTLDVKHFPEIEKLQLILQVVSHEMLTREFSGPILEKAFGVLLFAVGRVDGPMKIEDMFDCFGIGRMAMSMLQTETDDSKCRPMVELICNIGFNSHQLTAFFLENGLIECFGKMATLRQKSPNATPDFDEDLWDEMMRVLSNCMADGTAECYEPVITSPFLDTVCKILHGGTIRMKEQTVIFFQYMLCSEARAGYEEAVIGVMEKYDIVWAFSDILSVASHEQDDRRGDGIYMILNCLCCIQAALDMTIPRRGCDSPILASVRDESFKDTLQTLLRVNEKDIQEILASLLHILFSDAN